MGSDGTSNHAVIIVGYCIFDSNYKNSILLTVDSLNLICSSSEGEGLFALFEAVFHAVRYIDNTGKLNITDE